MDLEKEARFDLKTQETVTRRWFQASTVKLFVENATDIILDNVPKEKTFAFGVRNQDILQKIVLRWVQVNQEIKVFSLIQRINQK